MPIYLRSTRSSKNNKELILQVKGVKFALEGNVGGLLRTLNERESKNENKKIGEGNDAVYIQMNKLIIILR
jgi:hypothetical protein